MQFESLKIFCDIVRHRSFSQAASANDVSQSAASQVVLQLERRLGVQLIDRSTRPFELTREGRAYYDGCKRLVEQYMELESAVRSLPTELAATVQVAAIYSVGLRDMSQYVQRFAAEQPDAEIHIEYLHPDRVVERVLDGTADLGLVSFPRKSRELQAIPWRKEQMVLAIAPGHRLARRNRVSIAQLAGEKYVAFDKGLSIRREVDRFLRDHRVAVEVALEFDNIENIKKAIEISAGVAILPLPTLKREIQEGTLRAVPLRNGRFVRPLGIIHRRNHPLSAAARRFIELLRLPDEPLPKGQAVLGVFASGARPQTKMHGSTRNSNGQARSSKRTA